MRSPLAQHSMLLPTLVSTTLPAMAATCGTAPLPQLGRDRMAICQSFPPCHYAPWRALCVYGGADFRRTFTLTLIVSTAGGKLLPSVIKRCKTQRARDPGTIRLTCPAKKGWSNQRVLCKIITSVNTPYTKGEQCALVLDIFSGHTTPKGTSVQT